jgi:hypothetical protein
MQSSEELNFSNKNWEFDIAGQGLPQTNQWRGKELLHLKIPVIRKESPKRQICCAFDGGDAQGEGGRMFEEKSDPKSEKLFSFH